MKNWLMLSVLLCVSMPAAICSMDVAAVWAAYAVRHEEAKAAEVKTGQEEPTLVFEADINKNQQHPEWLKEFVGTVLRCHLRPYAMIWKEHSLNPKLGVFATQENGVDADLNGRTFEVEYEIERTGLTRKSATLIPVGSPRFGSVRYPYALCHQDGNCYKATLEKRTDLEPLIKVCIKKDSPENVLATFGLKQAQE